ncbi:mitochondrial translation elongation factor G [Planoprotostelium fungivorum]|uniref:Elongation factor G, mitochondrial n=1 Tax=Planoprotostelium fungivorum TaxID=1890364 RepID=A0A2P6NKS0_9EUKA|nr:mitochondrial translation elongation factor G [Planoprotostelium fungivorum]
MMLRTLTPLSRSAGTGITSRAPKTTFTPSNFVRFNATAADYSQSPKNAFQIKMRNVGISAHIDSGKTTLTERILFYTGRINQIHEVKGKDQVGATMDFMDLEREKGITIQSAATYASWGDHRINIIDTPGHVDFTIEVERALRVLDGAVLVMCGVSGVQSQTITVDRQMRRYSVPRLVFINKLDRAGGDPIKVTEQLKKRLGLNATLINIPMGKESNLHGVIDLIHQKGYLFEGNNGEEITEINIPEDYQAAMKKYRGIMLDNLAMANDEIAEMLMEEQVPTGEQLEAAIRKSTLNHTFTPVLTGSALKNVGVQKLLDAVVKYLPNPMESVNTALNLSMGEKPVQLISDAAAPFVGLAFKLEETKFGQLTYMRAYSGTLTRADSLYNVPEDKKVRVPRLVRMHAQSMEDISEIKAGDICGVFGMDCATGTTFTAGQRINMTSMHVPEPVLSLSISTDKKGDTSTGPLGKALAKFQKEDPTFRVHTDVQSGETIISGMGELHLEIYVERIRREYGVKVNVGQPQVAYKETIQSKANYNYLHKKQTGGSGQYAKVIGYLEPIPFEGDKINNEFVNATTGNNIPPNYIPACQKGFQEISAKGPLLDMPLTGVRMVLEDGQTHPVDSSELAFRTATINAFRENFENCDPVILEPIMKVEIQIPTEFQGNVMGMLTKRKGVIDSTEQGTTDYTTIIAEVPLAQMFGYSTELRSATQGKGEFSMEYRRHDQVSPEIQMKLVENHKKKKAAEAK